MGKNNSKLDINDIKDIYSANKDITKELGELEHNYGEILEDYREIYEKYLQTQKSESLLLQKNLELEKKNYRIKTNT